MTQRRIAEMIGVVPQQSYRYERGSNCLSARKLYEIARGMNTPVTYFYEGTGEEPRPILPHQRMLLEITQNFHHMPEKHQEALRDMVRVLADR